jgi:hypothetical protein
MIYEFARMRKSLGEEPMIYEFARMRKSENKKIDNKIIKYIILILNLEICKNLITQMIIN